MGRCAVTGQETNDKWEGKFISREIREIAKEMEADPAHKNKTMRQRLIWMQAEWRKELAKESAEQVEISPEASDGK